jgi:hypothetical protein
MTRSEQFQDNATECLKRAANAQQAQYETLYRNMAACWRVMAFTANLAEDGTGFTVLGD